MELREVLLVSEWLESQIGVPFVVVGGSAIASVAAVGTKDVDVLVDRRDIQRVERALDSRTDATPLDPASGTIRGTSVSIGSLAIDLEFIVTARLFSGDHAPEEFGVYVRERGSELRGGVRFAVPAVVFYMRFCTDEWKLYLTSIERDLRAGIPRSTLQGAVQIAELFGVGPKIAGRVAGAEQIHGLTGNASRAGASP
jgi:hypothetical protein